MDNSHQNFQTKREHALANLCTKYKSHPDRNKVFPEYSESKAIVSQFVENAGYQFYKTGQMFNIGKGITINRAVKKRLEKKEK